MTESDPLAVIACLSLGSWNRIGRLSGTQTGEVVQLTTRLPVNGL